MPVGKTRDAGWQIGVSRTVPLTRDLGCGNGLWMEQAALVGHVVGVDLSAPMLVEARARSGSPVACGDAGRLPFRDRAAAGGAGARPAMKS